jgi:hypothetical protein
MQEEAVPEEVRIRGSEVLHTVRFVTERYGTQGHDFVLKALPPRYSARLMGAVREASWEPLEDYLAYVERAHALLAPEDPEFLGDCGRYSGRLARADAVGVLLVDPETILREARVLWRTFFNAGRLDLIIDAPLSWRSRLVSFPIQSRVFCGIRVGFVEAASPSVEGRPLRVTETQCICDGADCCELAMRWE